MYLCHPKSISSPVTKWASISSFNLPGRKNNSNRTPKRATILWRLPNFGPKPLKLEALYFPSPLVRTLGPFLRRRAWPGRRCLLPSPPIRGGGRDRARPRAPRAASTPPPRCWPRRVAARGRRRRQRRRPAASWMGDEAGGADGEAGGLEARSPERGSRRFRHRRGAPPALPDAGHDERRRAVGGGGSGGGPRSPGWGRGRRS